MLIVYMNEGLILNVTLSLKNLVILILCFRLAFRYSEFHLFFLLLAILHFDYSF